MVNIVSAREVLIDIGSPMRNAAISFAGMTCSVVALATDQYVDGKRVIGFGYNSNGRHGPSQVLQKRIFARLDRYQEQKPSDAQFDPTEITRYLAQNEKPGFYAERSTAIGIVNMALWDIAAKLAEVPLFQLLQRRPLAAETPSSSVWVYAAGGYYYQDRATAALVEEIKGYLDMGFKAVKMKIGGAPLVTDLARIEAVLDILPDDCRLAVDANAVFSLPKALEYGKALAEYDLLWFEEPIEPNDYRGFAALAEVYPQALATGENLSSPQELRNLIQFAGLRPRLDYIQIDPVLSFGLEAYEEALQIADAQGWSRSRFVPHGGHPFNIHIAAAYGIGGVELYPKLFGPFAGIGIGAMQDDGAMRILESPGLGVEQQTALSAQLEQLSQE